MASISDTTRGLREQGEPKLNGIKLELFVTDIESSQNFYTRALGFELKRQEQGGYTALRNENVQIDLQLESHVEDEHPLNRNQGQPIGFGTEIVLTVSDINKAYELAKGSGFEIARPIRDSPWGSTDFRMLDPDGRYLRISTDDVWDE